MSGLTGEAAKAHVRDLLDKQRASTAERLDAARAEPGKEPFRLDVLARHLDVRSPITHEADPERTAELEREYYLRFPEAKTLEDFAEKKRWLDAHEAG